MKTLTLAIVVAAIRVSCGRANLRYNGYEDLVVAISPDIPQDDQLIARIEENVRELSRELFLATRKRAYVRSVKILLPKTWTYDPAKPIENESFETAEFRLDIANPVYGNGPYTVQSVSCGVPGSYIHLTTNFVGEEGYLWGNKGKTLVHEFAKLRWGVFEEHGYPGDEKFPMFFLQTTWTVNGMEKQVLENFCLEGGRIIGYEQDMVTGRSCTRDADGIPDGNCYFYVSQETTAKSSIMSVPYLSTNVNFCDSTEEYYHNTELPTKQNLYCEGKSAWEVISNSPDFANNTNPPNTSITNTDPIITVIGGGKQSSSLSYVLVMDISLSMKEKFRFQPMKDAAKRWIKFDLEEGVNLGLVVFSDEKFVRPVLNLTTVNEENRRNAMDIIENLKADGKTCIGCGIQMAKDYPGLLNGRQGNTIILITDGNQECLQPSNPNCISISSVLPDLVERKIRVVTIALGNEADPEIEDMAAATGGKTFYVDDSSGAGDINDAFTGSTTYQPGDTMGNKSFTVYQRDWTSDEIDADGIEGLIHYFDLDSSVGRGVLLQVDLRENSNSTDSGCNQTVAIQLVDPSASHNITRFNFTCNKENFGVFRHTFPGLLQPGRWIYKLSMGRDGVGNKLISSLSVLVTSQSRSEDSPDPIYTRCWIDTGSQALDDDEGINLDLAVVAEVRQGSKPVIGALVNAVVERPPLANGTSQPSLPLDLLDNGLGADNIKNDGIYSRYFAHYTGKGRYSVKCQVAGEDGSTQVNSGFIQARSLPEQNGTRVCCGSNTVFPDSKLDNTGNFTRTAAGGSFLVTKDITGNEDFLPPGRVTDLQATTANCQGISLTFTAPGGNLDDTSPAAVYWIKYSNTSTSLTGASFSAHGENMTAGDLAAGSSLTPVGGGQAVQLRLNPERFLDRQLFFALRAEDSGGNASPTSNVVGVISTCISSSSVGLPSSIGLQLAIQLFIFFIFY